MANLTTSATTVANLSYLDPDGTSFGQSATDLISFYGATPIVQPTNANQAAITTGVAGSVTTTTPTLTAYGYTTAQAAALLTAVNNINTFINLQGPLNDSIRTALVNLGLIKGA